MKVGWHLEYGNKLFEILDQWNWDWNHKTNRGFIIIQTCVLFVFKYLNGFFLQQTNGTVKIIKKALLNRADRQTIKENTGTTVINYVINSLLNWVNPRRDGDNLKIHFVLRALVTAERAERSGARSLASLQNCFIT